MRFYLLWLIFILYSSAPDYDGYIWMNWYYEQKVMYVAGFSTGVYSTLKGLSNAGIIDDSEWERAKELQGDRVYTIGEIVYKIDIWYASTGHYEYPICVVYYIRNQLHYKYPEWGRRDF